MYIYFLMAAQRDAHHRGGSAKKKKLLYKAPRQLRPTARAFASIKQNEHAPPTQRATWGGAQGGQTPQKPPLREVVSRKTHHPIKVASDV